MNWKAVVPLILALVLGLCAAKLGHELVVRGRGARTDPSRFTKIVVAKKPLEAGQAIEDTDVSLAAMSAELSPASAFKDVSELKGRVLMVPTVKGQLILESMLAPAGTGQGPQAMVPKGMRAVAVEVNEVSGVGGLLAPGCFVDVLSTLQDGQAKESVARTIVENVKVLAVGQRLSASDAEPKKAEGAELPKSVTLLVKPRDAEAIEIASSAGRVRLALRSPLDQSTGKSGGMTVMNLLGKSRSDTWEAISRVLSAATINRTPLVMQQDTPKIDPVVTRPTTRPAERWVEVIRNGVATRVPMELPAQEKSPGETVITNNDESQAIPGRMQ